MSIEHPVVPQSTGLEARKLLRLSVVWKTLGTSTQLLCPIHKMQWGGHLRSNGIQMAIRSIIIRNWFRSNSSTSDSMSTLNIFICPIFASFNFTKNLSTMPKLKQWSSLTQGACSTARSDFGIGDGSSMSLRILPPLTFSLCSARMLSYSFHSRFRLGLEWLNFIWSTSRLHIVSWRSWTKGAYHSLPILLKMFFSPHHSSHQI